jgi:hypothetical protein
MRYQGRDRRRREHVVFEERERQSWKIFIVPCREKDKE